MSSMPFPITTGGGGGGVLGWVLVRSVRTSSVSPVSPVTGTFFFGHVLRAPTKEVKV